MADFEITSPDGKKFIVTAPEGATQEQVLEFAKQSFQQQPKPQPSVVDQALAKRGLAPAPAVIQDFAAIAPNPAESIGKMAYGAGGNVTDIAARAGLPPNIAALAGTVANLGVEGTAGAVAGGAASPLMKKGARVLMQSSLKPNLEARASGAAKEAIETALTHKGSPVVPGIAATEGGIEGAQKVIGRLEGEINDILKNAPETVNKLEVLTRVKSAIDKFELTAKRPQNIKQIQEMVDDFWNQAHIKDMTEIPVQLANKMKQAFYKELTARVKAYQPGASLTAYDEAQKNITRGLKEEVAKARPDVAPSLKQQSDLINFVTVAGPQIGREGNKNILGLGWLSPTMQQTAGWMLDRYPWFKSFLARTMNAGSATIPAAATIAVTGKEQQ